MLKTANRDSHETTAVAAIARAMRNTSFYALDHPVVKDNIAAALLAISRLLENKKEFVIKIVEGEIIVDDMPLFDIGTGTANLSGACLRREVESISFRRGLQPLEIEALIAILSGDAEAIAQRGGAAAALLKSGVNNIAIEKLNISDAPANGASHSVEGGFSTYASAIDVLRASTRQVNEGLLPDFEPVNRIVSELIDSIIYEQASMLGLVSVKGKDEYTFTHALHICILCLELGFAIGLERGELQELGVCALLHDIGKIYIPLNILRKPSALNDEEFEIVQQHPLHGALLLSKQENAPPSAPLVAFEHHLHYDLSGYPRIAQSRAQNFYSLLVSPADVYDALTTDRPYRSALAPQRALEVMHQQSSHFEPRILDCFGSMLGEYPAGTLVRLEDGRLAVVSKPNPQHISRPFIRLINWTKGDVLLDEGEHDLSFRDSSSGAFAMTIAEVANPIEEGLDVCELLGGNPFCIE